MQMKDIREFLRLESTSGITLFLTAIAAIILANSSVSDFYQKIFQQPLQIQLGTMGINQPLLFWINEGLMTLFFLLVGLELKREIVSGELSQVSKVMLPGMAALGGMLFPALIYSAINYHNSFALRGWAIPVATDIAFALGVLNLFGRRVPLGLKLFLMALAIFDDIGAILIIAFFYTNTLAYSFLGLAVLLLIGLFLLNVLRVRWVAPYLLIGCLLWICILKSGVHATVAGVLLALMIPADMQAGEKISPLRHLENILHPWVAFIVMPLFALANAGLSFAGLTVKSLSDPIVLGIIGGLFLGKQAGVLSFTWLMTRLGWARLPVLGNWLAMYGVTLLCGVGFTMSLFLGTLAFLDNDTLLAQMRLGVLVASVISSLTGAIVLGVALKKS